MWLGEGDSFWYFFFTFYKGSTVYWKLGYLVRISVMLYKMCLTILLHWISSYCYWLHSVTAWSCSLGTWYSAVHSFNEAEVSSVVCGEHRCDHSIWHTQIEQQYDWPVSGGEAGRADQICYSGTLFSVSSPRLCSRTTLKAPKMQFYKCILFGLSYSAGVLMVACRIAFVEFFFFFFWRGEVRLELKSCVFAAWCRVNWQKMLGVFSAGWDLSEVVPGPAVISVF